MTVTEFKLAIAGKYYLICNRSDYDGELVEPISVNVHYGIIKLKNNETLLCHLSHLIMTRIQWQ